MRQAAGGRVPERLEGVDPDVLQDKCQGLTPNKKVCQKDIFSLSFYSHGGFPPFSWIIDSLRGLGSSSPITKNSHVTVNCLFVCLVLFWLQICPLCVSSKKPVGLCLVD